MTKEELQEKRKKRKVKKKKAKRDACYHKIKRTAKVWPSAYASGRLVQCRKVGAANYGNKSKKNESVNEEFEKHKMYDPKTGKVVDANKEEDHNRLSKQGYTHVNPKELEKVLKDEGGASGMDPFVKTVGKGMEDEIEDALEDMPNVGQHKDKDYILDDGEEIDVQKEEKLLKKKIKIRIRRKIGEGT